MDYWSMPSMNTPMNNAALFEDPILPFFEFVLPRLWDKFRNEPDAWDYERLAHDLNNPELAHLMPQVRSSQIQKAFEFFRGQRKHFVPNRNPHTISTTGERTGNRIEPVGNEPSNGAIRLATTAQSDTTSGPRYPCEFCHKTFESRKPWLDHRNRTCFPRKEAKLECQICQSPFTRRDNLLKHFRDKHPNQLGDETSPGTRRNHNSQSSRERFHQKCSYCVQNKKYPPLSGSKVGHERPFQKRVESDEHIFEHMEMLVNQGFVLKWVDYCSPPHETRSRNYEHAPSHTSSPSINHRQAFDEGSVGSSHQPTFFGHPQGPNFGDSLGFADEHNYTTRSNSTNEVPFGSIFEANSHYVEPRRAISLQGDSGDASRPSSYNHAPGGCWSSTMSLPREECTDTPSSSYHSYRSAQIRRPNRQQPPIRNEGRLTSIQRWLTQPPEEDPLGITVESTNYLDSTDIEIPRCGNG